jgi:hypothetical protein
MWWWALPAALLIGAAAWATSAWLFQDLDKLPIDKQISARIEAAAAAGVGAAVTLMLAVRRQRHQELATAHTTHDAAERRVTELYTKAVEQLGSDQAPVRLGGLYALERLAQDTPALRQTIVDVICAYLRMPYTPPRDEERIERIRAAQRFARAKNTSRLDSTNGRDPHEERQVREAAQDILIAHLRYHTPAPHRWWRRGHHDSNTRFWPDIDLHLDGATLIWFALTSCHVRWGGFDGATFIGYAWFEYTTFTQRARFIGAKFTETAMFIGSTFDDLAQFDRAFFADLAIFDRAIFNRQVQFNSTVFAAGARFRRTTFARDVYFTGTSFKGSADFDGATFSKRAYFANAQGLEASVLNGTRVAITGLKEGEARSVWPPCWRVGEADGWQTLSLVSELTELQAADPPEE